MTSRSPYGPLRALFVTLCLILIGASIIRYVKSAAASVSTNTAMQPVITLPRRPVTVPTQRTEEPLTPPTPLSPAYQITPTLPNSGSDPDYTMQIDECHRAGDHILCSGKITNNTDASASTYLYDSTAIDDEGNSFFIGTFGGGLAFQEFGDMERIMPSVPTKFIATISDAHRNVKAINLQITVDWTGGGNHKTLSFRGVPVQ